MKSAIVGAKGQVVIPKKIRAMFHIKTGTRVHFEARRGEIVLILRLRSGLSAERSRGTEQGPGPRRRTQISEAGLFGSPPMFPR